MNANFFGPAMYCFIIIDNVNQQADFRQTKNGASLYLTNIYKLFIQVSHPIFLNKQTSIECFDHISGNPS
jgi:hypothetical protein